MNGQVDERVDAPAAPDGRRTRGDHSRRLVLSAATDQASIDGLDGLSIGGVAANASMSKGGIVALFGSKEHLQLATIAAAAAIFREAVIDPALEVDAGLPRLRALVEGWIEYSRGRVFSGGCFFAATRAEFGSKPGAVRDALASQMTRWNDFLVGAIDRAILSGDFARGTDAPQLAFELNAMLDEANAASLLFRSDEPYDRAIRAIDKLLFQPS